MTEPLVLKISVYFSNQLKLVPQLIHALTPQLQLDKKIVKEEKQFSDKHVDVVQISNSMEA